MQAQGIICMRSNRARFVPFALELRVYVHIQAKFFSRIDAARQIEANQSVEEGHAGTSAAQWPADALDLRTITGPANVTKEHGPHANHLSAELEAAEPERIARNTRVRALSTNGVRAS